MENQIVVKETYLFASKKTGLEVFIGTSAGSSEKAAEKAEKYGKNGKVFLRAFEYDKGRETQIVVMLDPSEAKRFSKSISYVMANKGKTIPAIQPHKFGPQGQETVTTVYVDTRVVEASEEGKQPTVYCGFTVTRKSHSGTVSHKIPVTWDKFDFAVDLFRVWSVRAAFNERIWRPKDQTAGSVTENFNMEELPPSMPDDLGGFENIDDIPF